VLFTPFNDYVYTSLVKLTLFTGLPLLHFAISKEGRFRGLFLPWENKKSKKLSILLGAVAFVAVFIGFAIIRPWLDGVMVVNALSNAGITGDNYIFAITYYIIINVALEELFFRGFIFLTLYRMGYKHFAHIFSSLLFALYHVAIMRYGATPGLLLVSAAGLVAVGLVFNQITKRCGNVIGSYIVHASASLAISLVGFYFIR